jgi:nucleoside phosphorylase
MSDPKQYTVGWICALPIEHTAARQFLDQEHDSPDVLAASDTNTYTLGEIAGHNVVIAVLPRGEYGLSSASSVATNMLHSFPNIRVGLMVGIGGGAPSPDNDVRLGDIVVSVPKDGTGGVFQFDFGKDIQDQEFRPTAHTNQPPQAALTAISKLESTYESVGHQIDESIETILDKKPRLKKRYKRPDQDSDCLYISTVVHPEGCENQSCEGLCDTQPLNIIIRAPRETQDDNPTVHYGLIASSNTLMKNALVRDSLAGTGILCFEMEAAGLMNRFPCLVVRGICDYSDTHKNKDWQGYAAMAAAAYTKDLLRVMVPRRVESEGKLADVLGNREYTAYSTG